MRVKEGAGIILFRNRNEIEVLLLDNGEYWGFPGGTPDEGETLIETALRELKEETGLEPLVISLDVIHVAKFIKGEVKKSPSPVCRNCSLK